MCATNLDRRDESHAPPFLNALNIWQSPSKLTAYIRCAWPSIYRHQYATLNTSIPCFSEPPKHVRAQTQMGTGPVNYTQIYVHTQFHIELSHAPYF